MVNKHILGHILRGAFKQLCVVAILAALVIVVLPGKASAAGFYEESKPKVTWTNTNTLKLEFENGNVTPAGHNYVKASDWAGDYQLRQDLCLDINVIGRQCADSEDGKLFYIIGSHPNVCKGHYVVEENNLTNDVELSNHTSRILAATPGAGEVTLKLRFWNDATGECVPITDVTVRPGGDATVFGEWVASNVIKIYRDNKVYVQTASDPNLFIVDGDDGSCPDLLKTTGDESDHTKADYYDLKEDGDGNPIRRDCGEDASFKNIKITKLENKSKPPLSEAEIDALSGASATGSPDITCEVELFNPLTWIACPLIEAAQLVVEQFDNAITRRLTIPTNDYFETKNKNAQAFYRAWSTFRYLALILLVIIGLIMIIAQATSAQIVDAYTIKKVMPKIFIAVIAISLSWSLMKFAIDLSNYLGTGLRSIIFAPFGSFSGPNLGAGAGSFLTIGAGVALTSLGMLGMLSFALTAMLAVVIGFAIIVFREMLIMLLVVTAPVAIIAWILPNTQKIWKLWNDFFTKALLAFPIITLMIATGHVFSMIAANGAKTASGGDALLWTVISFISYFGPYFMIPAAFRMAGGALATISGMANDRTKGGFDRLKNFRKQKSTENAQKIKSGARWTRNPIGRAASRGLQTGSLIGNAGFNPTLMRSRINAARGIGTQNEMRELMEKNADIQTVLPDDDLMAATQYGRNRSDIERRLLATGRFGTQGSSELAKNVSLVERAQRAGSRTAVNSAMALGRAQTGTAYATSADMHESILQAAGGDRVLEGALLAGARSGSEKARRPDLAGTGHVDQAAAMDLLRATMGGDAATHAATRAAVNADMRQHSMQALGAHGILNGRTASVQQTVQQLGADWDAAVAGGDVAQATEIASQITSLRGAMGSAPPDARREVMSLLDHVGIDAGAINPETGAAYSTDEQLGHQLGTLAATVHGGAPTEADLTRLRREATQQVRTRAGLYDAGGGDRTPAELRGMRPPDPAAE